MTNIVIAVVLYWLPGWSFETYALVCVVFIIIGTSLTMQSSFRYPRSQQKR